jgi:hypothetical protein
MAEQLFDALDVEWRASSVSRSASIRLREWGDSTFAEFVTCAAIVDVINTRGDVLRSDRLLSALIARAATDDLAARMVLQALMPGLRSLAFRYRRLDSREDVAAMVIAEAFDRIRTYPFERRPIRIAANVLMDVRQSLHRIALVKVDSVPVAASVGREDEPSATRELLNLVELGVRADAVSRGDASVIVRSRILDASLDGLVSGMRPASLRQRRFRAERRLRAFALAMEG